MKIDIKNKLTDHQLVELARHSNKGILNYIDFDKLDLSDKFSCIRVNFDYINKLDLDKLSNDEKFDMIALVPNSIDKLPLDDFDLSCYNIDVIIHLIERCPNILDIKRADGEKIINDDILVRISNDKMTRLIANNINLIHKFDISTLYTSNWIDIINSHHDYIVEHIDVDIIPALAIARTYEINNKIFDKCSNDKLKDFCSKCKAILVLANESIKEKFDMSKISKDSMAILVAKYPHFINDYKFNIDEYLKTDVGVGGVCGYTFFATIVKQPVLLDYIDVDYFVNRFAFLILKFDVHGFFIRKDYEPTIDDVKIILARAFDVEEYKHIPLSHLL